MPVLSFETIAIIAHIKILLVVTVVAAGLLYRYFNKPWAWALLASLSVSGCYALLAAPLQKMWWGNNGDEIFIISFLSQVLKANPLNDFYYHGLPNFYPPLYFWVTGLLSRITAENAVTASKIGVLGTFFLWFWGTYLWQKCYSDTIATKKAGIFQQPWFWFALPVVYFALLDFNDIILKPYETLPAMGMVLLLGMIAHSFQQKKWSHREYLFFGISGGLLFLAYYFWWFMAIPALFGLALTSERGQRWLNTQRVIFIGLIMFAISAIYLIPLFWSYRFGLENWQGNYFTPNDFTTFIHSMQISWRTPLVLLGLWGLFRFRKKPFITANIWLLAMCYTYQFLNIFMHALGGHAQQAAKPFLFLGSATIAIGAAYAFVYLWQTYATQLSTEHKATIIAGVFIVSFAFWPHVKFIDDPVVRAQIEKDLTAPQAHELAYHIKKSTPNHLDRTWLSSGMPELNIYEPLHYYIAHNPHFSHHAAIYSQRLAFVDQLAAATPEEFVELINTSPIDGLILWAAENEDTYRIYFWHDNYPNGGVERVVHIPQENVAALNWQVATTYHDWKILFKPLKVN
jgi:hypothetical protein